MEVPLDASARETDGDRVLAGGDTLLEDLLVLPPLRDDLRVRVAPVGDNAERLEQLPDTRPVALGERVSLDAGDVANDEHGAPVELRP